MTEPARTVQSKIFMGVGGYFDLLRAATSATLEV